MKRTVIGILAHVDAGKTTLSESMLYLAGNMRKLGRVDHQDSFLDYNSQERNRGITIFSKEARMIWNDTEIILLDTPGHVDFSAEMERTLQVLDYAIVVVNGLDGIQNHTKTIWNLLSYYRIPTFIFMNKMDMPQTQSTMLLKDLQQHLDERCLDLSELSLDILESIALYDDQALEEFLQNQTISHSLIQNMIQKRQLFPVSFGSALKLQGVKEFLDQLTSYIQENEYSSSLKVKVYKISRDEQGQRLTHIKVVGGSLQTKQMLGQEKIDQIRQYNGLKYQMIQTVTAGDICAIKGLQTLQAGDIFGDEIEKSSPRLTSYYHYHICLPADFDRHLVTQQIMQLQDEDPTLHLHLSSSQEIEVQLMGDIQIEVLQQMIKDRFHVDVTFDQGQILYKETILEAIEGVGHFEPLRHYAEVHVLLEPLPRGSGLQFETDCSYDILEKHWQRLILTHMQEKEHLGVLMGAPITDIKMTLLIGKAHAKHTEGGDFRQATYRAIRNALKKASSILLEPYYSFHLEIPYTYLSKAIFDIENMTSQFHLLETTSALAIIEGQAPIRLMNNYQSEVLSYTKGQGRLYCSFDGYQPCQNQDTLIKEEQYDSESDVDNPTGSIFCSHGAGYFVPWNEVEKHMHLPYVYQQSDISSQQKNPQVLKGDEELEEIFTKTYGPVKRRLADDFEYHKTATQQVSIVQPLPECLLVDGYNVIHSWAELKKLAHENLDVARQRLIDILGNYQGYKQCILIIVFDAYKVKGNIGQIEHIHNVDIVYTKEAQTADMYIEKVTHELSQKYNVVVATSDALEQMIILGRGARRMSSRELLLEVESYTQMKKAEFERKQEKSHNFLLEGVKKYNEKS